MNTIKSTVFQKKSIWKLILAAILLLLPVIFTGSNYLILILCFIEIYVVAVSGLDIVFGYCGQISMGHAAFYCIGTYGSAMLHNLYGVPVMISMLVSSLLAAGIGAIIAYPASKLKFHFLSLATIAFGEIIYLVVSHSPGSITGNFTGIFTDFINFFGFEINTNTKFYYFGLACVVIFLAIKVFLVNSKTGRAFTAIRENTHAADGMGINVRKYKVIAFATSAFFTAFAGAMYVHLVKFASPETFMQKQSVMFLTMLLFGGTGSLLGPIFGSVSVLVIIEMLRSWQEYQMLVFGILLLIVIVVIPGGIYGACKGLILKITSRFKKSKEVDSDVNS